MDSAKKLYEICRAIQGHQKEMLMLRTILKEYSLVVAASIGEWLPDRVG